jgi:hypothetical protein
MDPSPIGLASHIRERGGEILQAWERVAARLPAIRDLSQTVLRDGREPRTFLSIKFPIRGLRGELAGVAGVSTDITERRRWERGQALLLEVQELSSSSLEYEAWLAELGRRTLLMLADCCIIDLLEEDATIRRFAVAHRDPRKAELARRLQALSLDRARPHLVQAVLTSREPVFMQAISPRYLDTVTQSAEHRRLLRELAPRSMIQVPLLARQKLLGAVVLIRNGSSPPYDRDDLRLANEIGWRTSIAIDNSRLYLAAQRAGARGRRSSESWRMTSATRWGRSCSRRNAWASSPRREEPRSAGASRPSRARPSGWRSSSRTCSISTPWRPDSSRSRPTPAPPTSCCGGPSRRRGARVEAAGLSLDVEAPGSLPLVHADRERIQQLFGNLIENAVKFTPSGGRIRIGATRGDREVRFFVRDSGPGFPPESLTHIFDRYWRGRRRDRRGIGLGLSIARGIVEAHGGRIWASNEHGGGTVHFTLPEAAS